jgi:hypothetical protein
MWNKHDMRSSLYRMKVGKWELCKRRALNALRYCDVIDNCPPSAPDVVDVEVEVPVKIDEKVVVVAVVVVTPESPVVVEVKVLIEVGRRALETRVELLRSGSAVLRPGSAGRDAFDGSETGPGRLTRP